MGAVRGCFLRCWSSGEEEAPASRRAGSEWLGANLAGLFWLAGSSRLVARMQHHCKLASPSHGCIVTHLPYLSCQVYIIHQVWIDMNSENLMWCLGIMFGMVTPLGLRFSHSQICSWMGSYWNGAKYFSAIYVAKIKGRLFLQGRSAEKETEELVWRLSTQEVAHTVHAHSAAVKGCMQKEQL